jgi:hypothetical protein
MKCQPKLNHSNLWRPVNICKLKHIKHIYQNIQIHLHPKKTVQIEKDHCCPGFKALKRKTDNENVKQTKSLKIEENILRYGEIDRYIERERERGCSTKFWFNSSTTSLTVAFCFTYPIIILSVLLNY